jgi:hypothetical protein
MKFNWGTGIFLFYGIFVLALVAVVIRSTSIEHSLVTDNYYQKDLEYQSHFTKLVNAEGLETDLTIQVDEAAGNVNFQFPADIQQMGGTILFFRPSKESLDFEVTIEPGENNLQTVPLDRLVKGLWKVKVDWTGDGKPYFKEEVLSL